MIGQIDKVYAKLAPLKLWSRFLAYSLFEGRPITTKGRWVNPIVFLFLGLWKKLPQLKKINTPIYIIGTGRSGTTKLGITLSIHDSIGYLNEPKASWHSIYSQEDLIGNYTKSPGRYRLSSKDVSQSTRKNAHRIMGAYLRFSRNKTLLDKYPELIFRTSFINSIFPDAKFIFIARNGYDTIQSIDLWSKRLGTESGNDIEDWWGVNDLKWKILCIELIPTSKLLKGKELEISQFKNHKDRATVEWILTMEEGLRLKQQLTNSLLSVRYEDILKNHRKELKTIMSFMGVDNNEKVLTYADKTITAPAAKKSVSIHPVIKEEFDYLMKELNYE